MIADFNLIQANILKSINSPLIRGLFIQFDASSKEIRDWLKAWAFNKEIGITTTAKQLQSDTDLRHKIVAHLSYAAYLKMEFITPFLPHDSYFRHGMAHRMVKDDLEDLSIDHWEDNYRDTPVDLLILIGANSIEELEQIEEKILANLHKRGTGKLLFTEQGERRYANGNAVEPFGFRDCISQPQIWDEKDPRSINERQWQIVLNDQLGSYLVFRKLEQNVQLFNEKVAELAKLLKLPIEMVEAQVIGRFKDGTPLTLFDRPSAHLKHAHLEIERFDQLKTGYEKDELGTKCPFHAHIRKVNPRNGLTKLLNTYAISKRHYLGRIVRRSIPYQNQDKEGLLFMCYQRSITDQFRIAQRAWSNNLGHSQKLLKGLDPIIGQSSSPKSYQQWVQQWGESSCEENLFDFKDVITLKGGEFFYAPPLSFFTHL